MDSSSANRRPRTDRIQVRQIPSSPIPRAARRSDRIGSCRSSCRCSSCLLVFVVFRLISWSFVVSVAEVRSLRDAQWTLSYFLILCGVNVRHHCVSGSMMCSGSEVLSIIDMRRFGGGSAYGIVADSGCLFTLCSDTGEAGYGSR